MAFDQVSTIKGSSVQYKMSDQAKKYTFRDLGFIETKQGNLQYDRPLDMTVSKSGPRLKITVAKDLKTLKMSVTTPNGLRQINIFEDDSFKDLQQNFDFILSEMVKRGCFDIVD
ncbi:cysteine desulfurase [Vagococcus elongatus]|uniref:Cysteine desulfurase n=1 Tax=Vagococcus elongatus TaxID=180344 RepID=A0A430AU77_9ENTE|nr:cysteine desulfurase [Vagococcus elongatus]RSU11612.1 cysteine desulfurase [Vagococcus elongatus]